MQNSPNGLTMTERDAAFAAGFVFACYLASANVHTNVAPYEATEQSGRATQQALGAMGMTAIPGPRSLTTSDRRVVEHQRRTKQLGFVKGKWVG